MIEIIGKNGAGKSFIANQLINHNFSRSVGYTTRMMRKNEIDGIDYHFITIDKFKEMISRNLFIEYKFRNGNYYGLSKNSLSDNTILVSGNSKKIEDETGFKVFNIYIDSDILVRYNRVKRRNCSNQDIFNRFHTENFSFLDNFDALFINNDMDNFDALNTILNNIDINGSLNIDSLSSYVYFLQRKINEFNFDKLNNYSEELLKLLQFEEYLMRILVLEKGTTHTDSEYTKLKQTYYEIMLEFFKHYNINNRYTDNGYIIVLDNEEYSLDFKLKRRVQK